MQKRDFRTFSKGNRGNRSSYKNSSHGNGRSSQEFIKNPDDSYFNEILNGRLSMKSENDAKRFFVAMKNCGDEFKVLSELTDSSKAGLTILKNAFSILCGNSDLINASVIPFLSMLGKDELSIGSAAHCTAVCFRIAFETPGLLNAIKNALQEKRIEKPEVVAWFLVSVCRSNTETRSNPLVNEIAEILSVTKSPEVRAISTLLFPHQIAKQSENSLFLIDPSAIQSLEDLRSFAPRHDNDFPFDFRSIEILPSAQEINSITTASSGIESTLNSKIGTDSGQLAIVLDRQFRLLREDMIGPMKDELREELKLSPNNRKRIFNAPQLVDISMDSTPSLLVSVEIPSGLRGRISRMSKPERSMFFEESGRRVLGKDSMLLFLSNGTVQFVGLVTRRDKTEFSRDNGHFTIGVTFQSKNMVEILAMLKVRNNNNSYSNGPPIASLVFQATSSYFSYAPVLRCLKSIVSIPFEQELIHGENPLDWINPIANQSSPDRIIIKDSIREKLKSDSTQLAAVEMALSKRVALVQGPPGTGKTFVGVQVVQSLLANNPNERILCICYTNHALDDFLLSLHEDGLALNDIVRLGRSPKISKILQERCLGELSELSFDRQQSRHFGILKRGLENAMVQIESLKIKISRKHWGPNWWETARQFLLNGTENHLSAYSQLEFDSKHLKDFSNKSVGKECDIHIVGRKGKNIAGEDYLWRKWCAGTERDSILEIPLKAGEDDIWKLSKAQRKDLLTEWQEEWILPYIKSLSKYIQECADTNERIETLRTETKVHIARNAKILGCTTTSAAKHKIILDQIKPTVIIVEEAAEILESSVLTSLGSSVNRLIMIGDHKQLRPKLECYQLRKESGKGIDFDVSLFERLASQQNFPIQTLNIQHRMRPEISRLIRSTYPALLDHSSVEGRDDLRGVKPHSNVIFLNHQHNEKNDEEKAVLGINSKVNLHEVELAVTMIKYLLQQGYLESEIVVLTPYLGQLVQIQLELKNLVKVEISDKDFNDIRKLDSAFSSSDQSPSKSTEEKRNTFPDKESDKLLTDAIRVSTVDNFQGEEARIVIASLVRSNNEGDIGFVASPERLNVLLSRARDGLIIIGNLDTFRNARKGRKMWNDVLDILYLRNQVHNSFPALCQNHKTEPEVPLIDKRTFQEHVPNGGCSHPCGQILPSCPEGHRCPLKCHPIIDFRKNRKSQLSLVNAYHAEMKCEEIVTEKCPATKNKIDVDSHYVQRICSQSQAKPCKFAIYVDCNKGHRFIKHCFEESSSTMKCPVCIELETFRKKREEEGQKKATTRNNQLISAEKSKELKAAELDEERLNFAISIALMRSNKEEKLMEIERLRIIKKNANMLVSSSLTINSYDDSTANTVRLPEKDRNNMRSCINAETLEISNDTDSIDIKDNPEAVSYSEKNHNISDFALDQNSSEAANCSEDMKKSDLFDLDQISKLLNLAGKEDWVNLLEFSSSIINEDEYMKSAVSSFILLAKVYITGMHSRFLEEISQLDCRSVIETQNCNIALILRCITTYTCFLITAMIPSLKFTSLEYATEYLQHSNLIKQSINFPSKWSDHVNDAFKNSIIEEEYVLKSISSIEPKFDVIGDWEFCKSEYYNKINKVSNNAAKNRSSPSIAIDKLLKLTGLESVKRIFLSEYNRIIVAKEQGISMGAASYNTRCDGNPGTGKTTVARLYAQFLVEVNILPPDSIVKETTGSRLIADGIKGLTNILDELKSVGGGVVFVDEAYQLNPQQDQTGRQILNFILVHAEKLRGEYGDIVWIFAGYKKDMEKLFEHNVGLPSRFPTQFTFEDYTDEELLHIWNDILKHNGQQDASVPSANKTKSNTNAAKQSSSKSSIDLNFGNYRNYQQQKENEIDEWRNIWIWNSSTSTFEDEYNNITGYGIRNLGYTENPIISRTDNTAWLYDRKRKLWYDMKNNNRISSVYPGKPKPVIITPPSPPLTVNDPKWSRILIGRLGKMRGVVGFGNARAVRVLFDKTRKRQAERIMMMRQHGLKPDIFEFNRDDLLGPKADIRTFENSAAWKKIMTMEGLEEVKNAIKQLAQLVIQNSDREDAEKPMHGVSLNRIFLGNPGTGKTSVAKLYAEILSNLGLLSKGEVVLKNSSDFIGSALGTSETITRGILAQAEGSVLVIDEAYGLNPSNGGVGGTHDPYKTAVIDTIVEQVQGVPGEDRAVVLLGYRKQMENMLAAANPGLSRRFQMENAFEFCDYDDTALLRIMLKRAEEDGIELDISTGSFAIKQLAKARSKPNFGNAGAVNNLLSQAKLYMQTRLELVPKRERKDIFIREDFCIGGKMKKVGGEEDIFSDLVGCDDIIDKLHEYRNTISMAKAQGKNPLDFIEFNFLFVGSPGTGKTTVARKMGKLLCSLGILPTDEVVEITAADMGTGYAGQAGLKTTDVMRKACGKVLFIDEAYQLNPSKGGSYMQEVVDALVQAITSTELMGKMVVILAGYESDIDTMLNVNQGLKSRFSEKFTFKDFSENIISKMLIKDLEDFNSGALDQSVTDIIPNIAKRLKEAENFGNGRDVKTLSKRIFREFARRCLNDHTKKLQPQDLENALTSFISSKSSTSNNNISSKPENFLCTRELQHVKSVNEIAPVLITKNVIEIVDDNYNNIIPEAPDEANNELINNDKIFEQTLQHLLDARGLNSAAGVANLSTLSLDSMEYKDLADEISKILNKSIFEANEMIQIWSSKQANVREEMKKQEEEILTAKLHKRKALVPIWRCAVCGSADKPYIACYVSPFIVRYEEHDV